MKTFFLIVGNEHGHGYGISLKDVAKILGGLILAPVVVPVIIIKDKIKKHKEKKQK